MLRKCVVGPQTWSAATHLFCAFHSFERRIASAADPLRLACECNSPAWNRSPLHTSSRKSQAHQHFALRVRALMFDSRSRCERRLAISPGAGGATVAAEEKGSK